jgi:hypothetical protein
VVERPESTKTSASPQRDTHITLSANSFRIIRSSCRVRSDASGKPKAVLYLAVSAYPISASPPDCSLAGPSRGRFPMCYRPKCEIPPYKIPPHLWALHCAATSDRTGEAAFEFRVGLPRGHVLSLQVYCLFDFDRFSCRPRCHSLASREQSLPRNVLPPQCASKQRCLFPEMSQGILDRGARDTNQSFERPVQLEDQENRTRDR